MNEIKIQINDVSDESTIRNVNVKIGQTLLVIHPENTDTYDGEYGPILLEFQNGIPILYVWNDRNEQEPIRISLENAMIPKEEKTP